MEVNEKQISLTATRRLTRCCGTATVKLLLSVLLLLPVLEGNVHAQWEADIYPPWTYINGIAYPGWDGDVRYLDWKWLIRYAVGFDTAKCGDEFAAADCAPMATLGDGAITVIDVVQAVRYVIGLDPRQILGGPTNAVPKQPLLGGSRTISITASNLSIGQDGTVGVYLDAQGNESGLGFSLTFNPTRLHFQPPADSGEYYQFNQSNTLITINSADAKNGHIGGMIIRNDMSPFPPGRQKLCELTFTGIGHGPAAIGFSDTPAFREVSDTNATPLSATYVDGTVQVTNPPCTLGVIKHAGNVELSLRGTLGVDFVVHVSTNLTNWSELMTITNTNGTSTFSDPAVTDKGNRFYRASSPP